ncbi:MAG: hypothetical protein NXI31_14065 [bacterium]|nr:hypothetical protein [bacterium]
MTSKFLIRSLIAAVALTAACEVPAQSKKVKRSKASPTVVLKGEQGERVRVRLEEALELLRAGEASGEAHEQAIAALKAAMTELKQGDAKHADLFYRYAKTLRPDVVEGHGDHYESARKSYAGALAKLAKGAIVQGKAKKDGKRQGRAADLLRGVQGRIIDSEGRPVAGGIVLNAESGEPVVERIVLDREQEPARGLIGRIINDESFAKDYAEKVSKATYGYYKALDQKQGKDKKSGKSKKKGGVAYFVDDGDDRKVVYGRLDDDGRVLALGQPDKDHVIYGRLDDDGRVVALKRAKKDGDRRVYFGSIDGDGGAVAKVKKGGLSFLSSGGDDVGTGSGGDADIVKAIQGVRDELRAIRKLMAKAHATMDGHHGHGDGHSGSDSAKERVRYRLRGARDPQVRRRRAVRFEDSDGDRRFFGRDMTDREREVRREVMKSLRRRDPDDSESGEGDSDDGHDDKAKSLRRRWVEKASAGDNGWRVQLDLDPEVKDSKNGRWVEIEPAFKGLGGTEGNVFQWLEKGGDDKKAEFKARWQDVIDSGEGQGGLFWVRDAAKKKGQGQAKQSKKAKATGAKDGWVTLKKSKSKGSVR